MRHRHVALCALLCINASALAAQSPARAAWSPARARAWADSVGWVVGSNFIPSTAINQLEMWQKETFDPATIDRELAWAESLGFNSMRVFLHHLLWQQDSAGFLQRIDEFLTIADRHHIRPMFVLFDAVWDPLPHLGPQRAPIPHVHNSGWVQSPGAAIMGDTTRFDELRGYVQGVVGRFANDRRVLAWDLFNEPDNVNRPAYLAYEPPNKERNAFVLLRRAFAWARAMNPAQPLTAAPWKGDWVNPARMLPITAYMLDSSDVITFHSYSDSATVRRQVSALERYGRPVICSEYMARPRGSTFRTVMPLLKSRHVGAINWGFVSGKSQTIYPWDSWVDEYTAEPKVWFHDIFRKDGTPFDSAEVAFIRGTVRPRVSKAPFGTVDGYTLRNARGTTVHVITLGAIITSIETADREGRFADIVLGYDDYAGYVENPAYFGAVIGRYENRIAKGRFTLDGKTYQLPINNPPNSLHGGTRGLSKVVWKATPFDKGVVLTTTSPDGDQGYPGRLDVSVTYTLDDNDHLTVSYDATTDKATPVNLSQHSYFNLTGNASRDVMAHVVTLNASRYTPVDSTLIPTGELAPVAGTPLDFRKPTAIGARIAQDFEQLRLARGYDHNFVLDGPHAAHVVEPTSGRTLDVFTNQPGVQFYTGNFLDGSITGKSGRVYNQRYGFSLETQHFPDSPNHPAFPSTILRAGQHFRSTTVFAFGTS